MPNIIGLIISHFDGQYEIHNVIPDINSNILKCNFLTCGRNLPLMRLMAELNHFFLDHLYSFGQTAGHVKAAYPLFGFRLGPVPLKRFSHDLLAPKHCFDADRRP